MEMIKASAQIELAAQSEANNEHLVENGKVAQVLLS